MATLQTSRLTISPCKPADGLEFSALESDPEVMRHLTGGRVGAHVPDELKDTFLMPRGTEPFVWTARHTATGAFVGWFCLWPEDGRVAELGYRLRRAEWGQGLASEGASALVRWGFESGGYDRITASTMTVNTGSRRVLEKIGFTHMRTVEAAWAGLIPGGEEGEVHYELRCIDWRDLPQRR